MVMCTFRWFARLRPDHSLFRVCIFLGAWGDSIKKECLACLCMENVDEHTFVCCTWAKFVVLCPRSVEALVDTGHDGNDWIDGQLQVCDINECLVGMWWKIVYENCNLQTLLKPWIDTCCWQSDVHGGVQNIITRQNCLIFHLFI
jgi:hypothetical protein